ncbi:MAG: sugar ABC transporter ATP-binding protein [Oscillospiraceae bacterium]|jgi:ABC-type sugar transport system ATPase subunit|nr:sugar ABC transporter ATP-binding protein [Oscillospiraceae bacterium]
MAWIEARKICKIFPGVRALSDVTLSVEKGEVHAVVGENGAGKSTLMKILGGLYSMDSGRILIDGKECEIKSIADSLRHGISVIYQELNLMPALTVAENIYISGLPGKMGCVNYRELNRRTQTLIDSLGLHIRPTDYVSALSVSQRQMVEILKALSHNSEIIIMDEPTAALNNQEVETLYGIIRRLRADGKTIIYISHRLREVFDLSDRVTVLRDGEYIGTRAIGELDERKLVEMMVGRDISQLYQYAVHPLGDMLLEIKGLSKEGVFSDVSFTLRAGEVVGMAGLMGCGREDIVKSIYGLLRHDAGSVAVNGETVDIRRPTDAIKQGIGFVTEDRKDAGIFALMTVRENITLNILRVISKFRLISAAKERELLDTYTKRMNMRYANEVQRIMNLSGGNQQKFVLARALASGCKVLILCEPTRGIDVGAKAEIYQLLSSLSEQGYAILVISSELPEIMSICYRTLVIFQGRVTGNILRDEMDENLIMRCATGGATHFSEGAML